ncbi:hypothetical protein GCM10011313_08640 [Mycetocola zhadangensis]|nr:hypothetical protein GCM10011313_08640 [Mycetocola zhadangensis]
MHAPDATLTVKVDSQHTDDAYEIFEIDAPDVEPTPFHRTGWAKTYYVLTGEILVVVDGESFELGPGSSIAIPPNALHTFRVLSSSTKFLVFALTGGMGRFHADLDASVPTDRPVDQVLEQIVQVLSRHDVAFEKAEVSP